MLAGPDVQMAGSSRRVLNQELPIHLITVIIDDAVKERKNTVSFKEKRSHRLKGSLALVFYVRSGAHF